MSLQITFIKYISDSVNIVKKCYLFSHESVKNNN